MKIDQLKIGVILSYLQMALSIIIGLLYTPIMLDLLGQSEYGLYNTVSSTVSLLSILSLGFNSSYVRYYAKYKKENNQESIWKLNGLFLLIFSIIGVVALACGAFLTFNLDLLFDQGITTQEYEIARVLMAILTANLAVSFPMSVFSSIISANEKFVFLKLLGAIKTVLGPLVTLPLLLMGYRSIAMVTVTVATNFIVDVFYVIFVVIKLKNKFVFHGFEKGLFKSLFAYTSIIAVNLIVDQLNWNIDKVILGRFKGTIAVSVYSIGYTLYSYYMMFSSAISSVFTPKIHKILNDNSTNTFEQKKQFTTLFVKIGRAQFFVLALLGTGLIFFGKEFITCFWAGDGYQESYYVLLLLMIPATVPLIQNIGIEVQRAQNKHKFRSVLYLCMAIVNLVISIFLAQRYGPVGSAIGTAISLVLVNGIAMNIYYHLRCNINILEFWKNILRISVGLIIPVFCGLLIRKFFDLTNILWFFVGVFVYAIVYFISIWLFSLNAEEKSQIAGPFKKILRIKNDKNKR